MRKSLCFKICSEPEIKAPAPGGGAEPRCWFLTLLFLSNKQKFSASCLFVFVLSYSSAAQMCDVKDLQQNNILSQRTCWLKNIWVVVLDVRYWVIIFEEINKWRIFIKTAGLFSKNIYFFHISALRAKLAVHTSKHSTQSGDWCCDLCLKTCNFIHKHFIELNKKSHQFLLKQSFWNLHSWQALFFIILLAFN